MGRRRLTDAERAQRRKERNAYTFSDAAYSHYDPEIEGFGQPGDWERIAEQLFGHIRDNPEEYSWTEDAKPQGRFARFLSALGLAALPSCLAELTRAFRSAMFKAHPDYGGTNAKARDVLEAYAMLKREVK